MQGVVEEVVIHLINLLSRIVQTRNHHKVHQEVVVVADQGEAAVGGEVNGDPGDLGKNKTEKIRN